MGRGGDGREGTPLSPANRNEGQAKHGRHPRAAWSMLSRVQADLTLTLTNLTWQDEADSSPHDPRRHLKPRAARRTTIT